MKRAAVVLALFLSLSVRSLAAGEEAPRAGDADAADRRAAWAKRGGALVSYEARANATFITSSTQDVGPAQCAPPGFPSRSHDGSFGFGGGLRASLVLLDAPTYEDSGNWAALRFGGGLDAGYLRMPTRTFDPVASTTNDCVFTRSNEPSGLLMFPLFIGGHYGIGSHRGDGGRWKGIVLGLGYAPSYFYITGNTAGGGMFNLAGFEISVDIATLDAARGGFTSPPTWRFALFVLPAVTASLPLFATASFGAVWY